MLGNAGVLQPGDAPPLCLVHAMTASKHRLAMRLGKMQRICPKEVCMQTDMVSDMAALLACSKARPGFAGAGTRHTGGHAKQPAQALKNTAEHEPTKTATHACAALSPFAHAQNTETAERFCRHMPTFPPHTWPGGPRFLDYLLCTAKDTLTLREYTPKRDPSICKQPCTADAC